MKNTSRKKKEKISQPHAEEDKGIPTAPVQSELISEKPAAEKAEKISEPPVEDDVKFPYSVELVAIVAAHFVDEKTTKTDAAKHALELLDAVRLLIASETEKLHVQAENERMRDQIPDHSDFLSGIRLITRKGSDEEAIEVYREFVRVLERLEKYQFFRFRTEQVGPLDQFWNRSTEVVREIDETFWRLSAESRKLLIEPLAAIEKQAEEDRLIEVTIALAHRVGFSAESLLEAKKEFALIQRHVVIPYKNSLKGSKPPRLGKTRGRPKKKKPKH